MRKAKVAAVTMGILASVLGGGYVVTDAATVRLDDSVTEAPETSAKPVATGKNKKTAAAKTSIKTTPAGTKNNAIRQHNRTLATAPVQEISPEEFQKTSPVENVENHVENTETFAGNQEIAETAPVSEVIEEISENPDNLDNSENPEVAETTRIYVKSVPIFTHKAHPETEPVIYTKPAETSTEPVTSESTEESTDATETSTEATEFTDPVIITKPATSTETPVTESTESTEATEASTTVTEHTTAKPSTTTSETTKATTKATTTTSTSTTTTTSTSTTTTTSTSTTTTTSTTPEPVITTMIETVPLESPEIVDVSEINLENILNYVQEIPQDTAPITEEIEIIPEEPEQIPEEPVFDFEIAETIAPEPEVIAVSDSDYVLLCNAVAHEAGSDNITIENKAKVVEVIMNRVDSPSFPDTVYGVITQKSQFSGSSSYANLSTYTSKVTQNVKSAVDLYFEDPSEFDHGYLYFYGDGSQNHFSQY